MLNGSIPFNLVNPASNQSGTIFFSLFGQNLSNGNDFRYFNSPQSTPSSSFSGTLDSTLNLGIGANLPAYQLDFSQNGTATINVPTNPALQGGRLIMSVGVPPPVLVNNDGIHSVGSPTPDNPVYNGVAYDFIEFAINGSGQLTVNTSNVDQFDFPLSFTSNPTVPPNPVMGASAGVSRQAVLAGFSSFLNSQPNGAPFQELVPADTSAALRIISPFRQLVLEGVTNALQDPLATYFNSSIKTLFEYPPSLTLVSVDGVTYTGSATTVSAQGTDGASHVYNVLQFTGSGGVFNVYEPFFNTNGGGANPPPQWLATMGKTQESPGQMVLANDGVFADNAYQPATMSNPTASQILGNLENQLVAALNRGIATLSVPSGYANNTAFWQDPTQHYPTGQTVNLYAKYLHQGQVNVGGTPTRIERNGLVYAIGFDDQGNQGSILINIPNPVSVTITFGPWLQSGAPNFNDFNSDGTADIVAGAGSGGGPQVKVFSGKDGSLIRSFFAFDPAFTGGISVAQGDLRGTGSPDIVAGAGPGGGPQVSVFSGKDGSLLRTFFAFDTAFTGGVTLALGDIDGDGLPDIVVGAGAGGGPQVKAFSGKDGHLLSAFFAFDMAFAGGVNLAVGDVNGDARNDIIVGAGAGGGPQVKAFSGIDGRVLASFFAFDPAFTGGVYVSAGNVSGGGAAEIIVGAGSGGGPQVKVFDAATANVLRSFFAYDQGFAGGARVGAIDFNKDGRADIWTGAGPGGGPQVRVFDSVELALLDSYFAFDPTFAGGVFAGQG